MEMERIVGALFSGFMCKLYAATFAIWLAYETGSFLVRTFATLSKGFAS